MFVKVCGLTTEQMVRDAVASEADAIGLVLAESSRQVSVELAEKLLALVPEDVQTWAVFREPDASVLREIASLPFTGVQAYSTWDGAGLPESMAWLPAFIDGPSLLDDLREGGFDGDGWSEGLVGAFLVDGPKGGGQGLRADERRCAKAAWLGPMVLAGGLDPENVREAIKAVQPYGVDVSSGVEAAPGRKDPALVAAFIAAAREEWA